MRQGLRWGFEYQCTDAPRTTRSMQIALEDPRLEPRWVVYPGTLRFPLADRITALPPREVHELALQRDVSRPPAAGS
ncbi:MAG: hypothetical protein ACO3G4_07900 [Opitutaceae bacterium]